MRRAPLSLRAQALALLGRREHSRAELRSKLLAHARRRAEAADTPEPPEPEALLAEVEAVLDWLGEQRYQSDARFIESRVHARAPRLGQARIRQELARHGVELDADTAAELRRTEVERAREVWRKRFGEPPRDAAERARQMRFLAARGFGGDTVRRVLGGDDESA